VKFSAARSELDSIVVQIELTLTSIVQGVALYFLIDNARSVLSLQQRAFWPYIISGLLTILIFWSRSVVHTLTLIRWPLEFGHNFFYIGRVAAVFATKQPAGMVCSRRLLRRYRLAAFHL